MGFQKGVDCRVHVIAGPLFEVTAKARNEQVVVDCIRLQRWRVRLIGLMFANAFDSRLEFSLNGCLIDSRRGFSAHEQRGGGQYEQNGRETVAEKPQHAPQFTLRRRRAVSSVKKRVKRRRSASRILQTRSVNQFIGSAGSA